MMSLLYQWQYRRHSWFGRLRRHRQRGYHDITNSHSRKDHEASYRNIKTQKDIQARAPLDCDLRA